VRAHHGYPPIAKKAKKAETAARKTPMTAPAIERAKIRKEVMIWTMPTMRISQPQNSRFS